MKIKDNDIIKFLEEYSDWASASLLAAQFNVSGRTVRNHIQVINKKSKVIESSPLGYRLKKRVGNINSGDSIIDPNNLGETAFMIIFTAQKVEISINNLMSRMYISESSLRSAISNFNQRHLASEVKISIKNGYAKLKGTEKNRRRLFHNLVGNKFKTSSSQDLKDDIQKIIPDVSLDALREIITSSVSKHELVVNGYELDGVLLHYAIAISRIMRGKSIIQNEENKIAIKKRPEFEITNEIIDRISSLYQIHFNSFEIDGLTLALLGKTISKNFEGQSFSDLKKYVPEKVIEVSTKVITDVDQEYNLQLGSSNFMVPFVMHINNMLMRVKFKAKPAGSEFAYLAKQYPFIYDIALYVLDDLSKRLNTSFDREEYIYLLLHLGAFVESEQKSKINTVIIIPKYYDNTNNIVRKITKDYADELLVSEVVSSVDQIRGEMDHKLVLTTINVNVPVTNYVVKISPLYTSIDKNKVRHALNKIRFDFKGILIKKYLDLTTTSELYFQNKNFKNKGDCLNFGAATLINQGFGNNHFDKEIQKRESMASTAFGDVAIPHTLEMDAKKTGILIINSKEGIQWDQNNKCHLIFMIAVAKNDVKMFGNLLQALISVLSINKNVNILKKKSNFEEFKLELINLLHRYDDLI